jgi:hydrogenase expression/formation protein HypE
METISLSYGGGGEEMNSLINGLFYKYFANEILLKAEDASIVEIDGKIAMSSDSFTVSPIFFAGGDIGKIAVAGSVNDVAMMGAKPLYMSSAFMIEEGFSMAELETIVASMAKELAKSGTKIICGDTKVVPKGCVDKIFINTTCIGEVLQEGISTSNISSGDTIIVSGDIGRHGAVIMANRDGIELQSDLQSDCATLWDSVKALIDNGIKIKALRDATRGGLSAVLNEWAMASSIGIEIEESKVPVCDEVNGICEMLGFEPYDFANEGTFVLAVDSSDSQKALDVLKGIDSSQNSAIIGKATEENSQKVLLLSEWGSKRYLSLPKGELLPRIC